MRFEAPWALLGLLLGLPLWWALRRAERPLEIRWPSLVLWRRVLAKTPAFRAPVRPGPPPWPVWLPAYAVLCGLVVAAARPTIEGKAEPRVAVLIDASASMRAPAKGGGSRLEAAKRLAALLEPAATRTIDPEAYVQSTGGDSALLETAYGLFAAPERAQLVVLVTDHPLSVSTSARSEAASRPIVPVVIGSAPVANAGLVHVGARVVEPKTPAAEKRRLGLLVRVGAEGPGVRALLVRAEQRLVGGRRRALFEARLSARPFEAPARLSRWVELEPGATLEVRVQALDGDGRPVTDRFPLDDRVVVRIPADAVRLHAALGVEALPPVLRVALEAAGGRSVEVERAQVEVAPANVTLSAKALGKRALFRYAAHAAGGAPPGGALWLRASDKLVHTDLSGLSLPVAPAPLPPGGGWRALVVDAHGRAVVAWREQGGQREAWIGLPFADEALAAALARHPGFPVLVAELLQALTGRGGGRELIEGLLSATESAQALGTKAGPFEAARARVEAERARVEKSLKKKASRSLVPWLLGALTALLAWLWRPSALAAVLVRGR